jgi:hypothetical protein
MGTHQERRIWRWCQTWEWSEHFLISDNKSGDADSTWRIGHCIHQSSLWKDSFSRHHPERLANFLGQSGSRQARSQKESDDRRGEKEVMGDLQKEWLFTEELCREGWNRFRCWRSRKQESHRCSMRILTQCCCHRWWSSIYMGFRQEWCSRSWWLGLNWAA